MSLRARRCPGGDTLDNQQTDAAGNYRAIDYSSLGETTLQGERFPRLPGEIVTSFGVISLREILRGLTGLPASKRRDGLREWLDESRLRP